MPTRSGLKITCLAKVGLATNFRIFPPNPTEVASHQLFFERFPWIFRTPEQWKQKKRLVKQSKESSRTLHKVCRDLKQRVQRNLRVTYRIVHEFIQVFLEVVRGSCLELGVLVNIGGHPGGLMEGENFVDFDNTQANRQIKLQVAVVEDVSCFPP